jgi:hypothetical protein
MVWPGGLDVEDRQLAGSMLATYYMYSVNVWDVWLQMAACASRGGLWLRILSCGLSLGHA